MFYFDYIDNKKILKSDLITGANNFFTTSESVITPKNLTYLNELCEENMHLIAGYLDLPPDRIIVPTQVHGDCVSVAKYGVSYPSTDALLVEDDDIAICLNFADCTPIIIYDQKNNVGGIVHAGWRGTASSILKKTINIMQKRYSSNSEDILAVIGPAISSKNYQVDANVFNALTITLNAQYNDYYVMDEVNNKYFVDLKTINQHQLQELGIGRIDKCEYCTYDSIDVFFSYRREQGVTARHSAILKLIK